MGQCCQPVGPLGVRPNIWVGDPGPTAPGPHKLQRSLAIMACLLPSCSGFCYLNRGRGMGVELTHSTSTHSLSHSLKLCSRGFIALVLKFDFKKPLSLISLLQENPYTRGNNSRGKNFHFSFINITRFELFGFVLVQT